MKSHALVCGCLGIAALAHGAVMPLRQAGAGSCFDRDLFSWDKEVDYRRALASGTLAPKRVVIRGRTVSTGLSEAALGRVLGPEFRVAENWSKRDAEQQCDYLRKLGLSNNNSMHYYILEEQNRRRLSGSFRVCEWTLTGVGTLRAFVHRPADSAVAHAYLLHLVMSPVPGETASYVKGPPVRLVRAGPPRVEWDVERNLVAIGARPPGAPEQK